MTETLDGRVVAVERNVYHVETSQGRLACRLRGRLARQASPAMAPVVGDLVSVVPGEGATGAIETVAPRRTTISRRAPGSKPRQQVLAANIDLAAVVVSLYEPRFKIGTVTQFVTGAQAGGVAPLVVLNKVDLGERSAAVAELELFAKAGIPYLLTSAATGEGLAELSAMLSDRWTLFYGQSGVGKSSLLNALAPGAAARVGAISESTHWGRHTTTTSRLYELAGGGYVVDTPGMRAFTFWNEPERSDLDSLYPEIVELAAVCRFADCAHLHEPGCAVKAAVSDGRLDSSRYRHYLRLAQSANRTNALRSMRVMSDRKDLLMARAASRRK